MRGFAIVALDRPKNNYNIGGAIRAAGCYGASMVVVAAGEFVPHPTAVKRFRHIPILRTEGLFDALPYDTVPVAIEISEKGAPLPDYEHPERAFYVFGNEGMGVSDEAICRCVDLVSIPTSYSMNLAATVNVVLYDRLAKSS